MDKPTGNARCLASREGKCPGSGGSWGWRRSNAEWRPLGRRIGWIDRNDIYLDPDAALAEVQGIARDTGESITIAESTLNRRLYQRGLLKSTEMDKARKTAAVRRKLEGRRREVLHLDVAHFVPAADDAEMFDDEEIIDVDNTVPFEGETDVGCLGWSAIRDSWSVSGHAP